MRIVTILVALVLLSIGPLLYLGIGSTARAERRTALAKLEDQRRDLEANLATGGTPPSLKSLAGLRADLDERRSSRTALLARVLAFRSRDVPTDDELRRAGERARLAAPILEPLLTPMPAGDLGAARRQVLFALFRALEESAVPPAATVSSLRLSREPLSAGEGTGLEVLRGQLEASGAGTGVALLCETILAVRADSPIFDLVKLDLAPDLESARTADVLPARVTFEFDAVIGEAR